MLPSPYVYHNGGPWFPPCKCCENINNAPAILHCRIPNDRTNVGLRGTSTAGRRCAHA